jgi:choline monooxygenase
MVEWYPHTLVVSNIIPTGVESCLNVVEFYYPEDIALFEREFVEAEKAAYRETAIEDDDICYGMHKGRKALYQQGHQPGRTLPVAHGGRHGALPRVAEKNDRAARL